MSLIYYYMFLWWGLKADLKLLLFLSNHQRLVLSNIGFRKKYSSKLEFGSLIGEADETN